MLGEVGPGQYGGSMLGLNLGAFMLGKGGMFEYDVFAHYTV